MKRIYLYITIAILGIVIVFLFNKINRFSSENKIESPPSLDDYTNQELAKSYAYIGINGLTLPNVKGVLSSDQKSQETDLIPLLRERKIVLYFSELACASCVSEQLHALNKFDKKYGNDKILLVTNYLQEEIKRGMQMTNMKFPVFELKGSRLAGLSDLTEQFVAITAVLLVEESFVITSCVTDSHTKHFNAGFYESLDRYIQKNNWFKP